MNFGIGVVGCGMVSHAYLGAITRAPDLELRALTSLSMASARLQASRYGGHAVTLNDMLDDPAIDLVVNLAPPATRFAIGRRVLEAGKHLYAEKPLALDLGEARDLLTLAETGGLTVGCAPDTFLGPGHQSARALIDQGALGRVTGGAVAFGSRGMESWHPNPANFYARGGGPLLDIGPYYITQLVNLLGPVSEVIALGSCPLSVRVAGDAMIDVDVMTTVNGALLFEAGANVSIALSWDAGLSRRAPIELHGETGSILPPDPNQFGDAVGLSVDGESWRWVGERADAKRLDPGVLRVAIQTLQRGVDPLTGGLVGSETALRWGDQRGLGVVDMVTRLRAGLAPRASGALAFHVLEVLLGLEASAAGAGRVSISSRIARPELVAG